MSPSLWNPMRILSSHIKEDTARSSPSCSHHGLSFPSQTPIHTPPNFPDTLYSTQIMLTCPRQPPCSEFIIPELAKPSFPLLIVYKVGIDSGCWALHFSSLSYILHHCPLQGWCYHLCFTDEEMKTKRIYPWSCTWCRNQNLNPSLANSNPCS